MGVVEKQKNGNAAIEEHRGRHQQPEIPSRRALQLAESLPFENSETARQRDLCAGWHIALQIR
jgi:hypothetical protein